MSLGNAFELCGHGTLTAAAIGIFLWSAWHAPWKSWFVGRPDRQHIWLGSLTLLLLIWSLRAPVAPGLLLHFPLVTSLTLMHGWGIAVVGISAMLATRCMQVDHWAEWPVYFLCDGVFPAFITHGFHRLISRRLPRNFFVYMFVTVFGGSIAAFVLGGLARLGVLAACGSFPNLTLASDYALLLVMMAIAEASMNGLVMSATVVYRPDWVASFEDGVYFAR